MTSIFYEILMISAKAGNFEFEQPHSVLAVFSLLQRLTIFSIKCGSKFRLFFGPSQKRLFGASMPPLGAKKSPYGICGVSRWPPSEFSRVPKNRPKVALSGVKMSTFPGRLLGLKSGLPGTEMLSKDPLLERSWAPFCWIWDGFLTNC